VSRTGTGKELPLMEKIVEVERSTQDELHGLTWRVAVGSTF
jgi:hypothetical protein